MSRWPARYWLPPWLLAVVVAPAPSGLRRRTRPVLAFAVMLAACCLVLVLRGGRSPAAPSCPLALVLYLVAATRGRRAALTALAAALALLTVQGVILSLTGRGAGNGGAAPA